MGMYRRTWPTQFRRRIKAIDRRIRTYERELLTEDSDSVSENPQHDRRIEKNLKDAVIHARRFGLEYQPRSIFYPQSLKSAQ